MTHKVNIYKRGYDAGYQEALENTLEICLNDLSNMSEYAKPRATEILIRHLQREVKSIEDRNKD